MPFDWSSIGSSMLGILGEMLQTQKTGVPNPGATPTDLHAQVQSLQAAAVSAVAPVVQQAEVAGLSALEAAIEGLNSRIAALENPTPPAPTEPPPAPEA